MLENRYFNLPDCSKIGVNKIYKIVENPNKKYHDAQRLAGIYANLVCIFKIMNGNKLIGILQHLATRIVLCT